MGSTGGLGKVGFFGMVVAGALAPRCNCDEGRGLQVAPVEMALTFLEEDSCSEAVVPRRIPDDYEEAGRPQGTDFGSRAERTFEIRSVGTAPLSVVSVDFSHPDPEFSLEILDRDGGSAQVPIQITADRTTDAPPALMIKTTYAAEDSEPDLVELVIRTDDPMRSEVRFGLTAGRGKLEICGTNGCVDPRVEFGDVSRGGDATEDLVLKNIGEGDLDLRAIKLESTSAEFCAPEATDLPPGTSRQECPQINLCKVLRPGEQYVVHVRYHPYDGGEDTGVIRVSSGDAGRGTVDVPIQGRGAGPAICACAMDAQGCTPVSLVDFGATDVGVGVPRTVRLTSCGTEPVALGEATLETGAAHPFRTGPEFAITTPFATGSLEPGAYSEGVITYTPVEGGEHRGGLRFMAAASQLKSWIALVGRASTCDLVALPMTVNFGSVASGSSADRTVLLANNGLRDCEVSGITDPTNGFALVFKPSLPLPIPSGQMYPLTVRYTAPQRSAPLSDASSFDVASNEPSPGEVNSVSLTAAGGGVPVCALEVQPSGNLTLPLPNRDGQLRFGAVNIGYRKTLVIRVANVGNTECRLMSQTLTTQAGAQFSSVTSTPLPISIQPGSAASIDVTFAPTGPAPLLGFYGGFMNHVDFTVQGAGLTKTSWSIAIHATPTVPTIDVIPRDVDFGLVTWQNPQAPDNRSACGSETRVVNVYNSGTGPLDILGIAIDSTSDHFFDIAVVTNGGGAVSSPYVFTVNPGGNASVELRFFPTRVNPATHNGLLVIENSVTGMGAPVTVPLRGEGTSNSNQTDVFQQLTDNKVDILWVVDDSGSMEEEQNDLGNNFSSFIGYADSINVDYQVGVITTEINDPPAGKLWSCNGHNKIITHAQADRAQAFQCAATVTNPPNGNRRPNPMGSDEAEAGLQSARLALDVPLVNNENAGFLRDEARLAVIIVSDEEDQSPGPVSLYVDFFRNIKGFRNPQLFSLSAIAGDVPNGCATAVEAPRYLEAAGQLAGQFESICTTSWGTLLQNIGLDVFALRQAWSLSRPANPSTIMVRVNGVAVQQNATNGWSFDAATNTVTFNGPSLPSQGSTIEVQYGALCLM